MPQYYAGHTYASPELIHATLEHHGLRTHREDAPANDDPLTQSLFWVWIPQHHINREAVRVRWGLTNSTPKGAYPRIFLQRTQEILADAAAVFWDAITEAEGPEAPPVRDQLSAIGGLRTRARGKRQQQALHHILRTRHR